jgi:hypothetical protein
MKLIQISSKIQSLPQGENNASPLLRSTAKPLFKEVIAAYFKDHSTVRKYTVWVNAEFLIVNEDGSLRIDGLKI